MIFRIATSEQFRDSPTRVRNTMSFRDFVGAHAWLDVLEEQQRRERAAADRRFGRIGDRARAEEGS